jgi:hypothetical protein
MLMAKQSDRPEGHPPQATWPPRVPFDAAPVTFTDGAVRAASIPEGGFGVRVGKMPMPGDMPRADGATEMPTDGPGVPRRAIPAPEVAVTTSTIPPPYVMTSDRSVKKEAAKVDGGDIAPPTPPIKRADAAAVSNPPGATTVKDTPAPKAAKGAVVKRRKRGAASK